MISANSSPVKKVSPYLLLFLHPTLYKVKRLQNHLFFHSHRLATMYTYSPSTKVPLFMSNQQGHWPQPTFLYLFYNALQGQFICMPNFIPLSSLCKDIAQYLESYYSLSGSQEEQPIILLHSLLSIVEGDSLNLSLSLVCMFPETEFLRNFFYIFLQQTLPIKKFSESSVVTLNINKVFWPCLAYGTY